VEVLDDSREEKKNQGMPFDYEEVANEKKVNKQTLLIALQILDP